MHPFVHTQAGIDTAFANISGYLFLTFAAGCLYRDHVLLQELNEVLWHDQR